MKFIPVIHKVPLPSTYSDFLSATIRITGVGLFSLIEAFKQSQFGLDTVYDLQIYQKKFRKRLITPFNAKEYIDSGGYSFIKGQIHPDDIQKLINCYLHYMIEDMDNYYRIFSLDLPISLKYDLYNTKQNVLYYNRISLLETFNVIDQIPQLSNKLVFIWHFKSHDLYKIWCDLHDELLSLGYSKYIKHRAIGGMVGIKGMTGIRFSPFIALAYRCFKDYVEAGMFNIPFRLHLLGVYTLPDRFIMAYIERIFEKYLTLESINAGVEFTYDSINYERQANYSSREFSSCNFEDDTLKTYSNVHNIPDHILRQIYSPDDLYLHVLDEINRIDRGVRLNFVGSFVPISLHSHISMDRFIENVIEKNGLIDIIFNSKSYTAFIENLEVALDQILKIEPKVLGSNFKRAAMDNLVKLYRLHRWWMQEGAKYKDLNYIIQEFIAIIDAPGKLL